MVVGQAPGVREGKTGLPFSRPAGKRLFSWLAKARFEEEKFRGVQYITAITKCYPGKRNGRGPRGPTAAEHKLCVPFLAPELDIVQPELIIPVGRVAIDHFLGNSTIGWISQQAVRV